MFAFHAGHLPTQQAKVVQSWKGVARVIHTATVQSAAEKATLTAENKALKSRRRELEAQTHDLQCIVVAAVAERDQLTLTLQEVGGGTLRQTIGRSTTTNDNKDVARDAPHPPAPGLAYQSFVQSPPRPFSSSLVLPSKFSLSLVVVELPMVCPGVPPPTF